jgi:uncharacterized membrane protein
MDHLNEPRPEPSSVPATDNGKTVAILSYLTLIGWIVAFVMHSSNKTALGAFHLRQALMLYLVTTVGYMVLPILAFIPFLGWLLSGVLWISLLLGGLVLWIMGLISAVNSEQKPLPAIGEQAQELFKGL